MDHHATSAFPFDSCLGGTENHQTMQRSIGRDRCFMAVLPGGTLSFTESKSAFFEASAPGFPTGFSLRLSPEVLALTPTWVILVSQVLALNPARKTNIMMPTIRPLHQCPRSPHRPCAPWTSHCYPDTILQRQLWVWAGLGMCLGTRIIQAFKKVEASRLGMTI